MSERRHDRASWEELKFSRSRTEFIREFAHPFLVTRALAPLERMDFHTRVHARGHRPDSTHYEISVFPVAKVPGNPYPDRVSVGRSRNCDIVIREDTVSKLHGLMSVISPSAADYVDQESANGTEINGARVAPKQAVRIKAGDRISVGSVVFEVWDPAQLYDEL